MKALTSGPIVRNAASLYASTVVTSVLGFAYWFAAARLLPASAVGTASAVQSATQFVAIISVFGLSTLLIGELTSDGSRARPLILTAVLAAGLASAALGVAAWLLLSEAGGSLRPGLLGISNLGIFVVLTALTTVSLILDDACIGLSRGDIQLRRNGVFALTKLLLVPLVVLGWKQQGGSELVAAWLGGTALSLIVAARELMRATQEHDVRLDFRYLYDKRGVIAAHHWLNVAIQSPRLVSPIVVATVVSPQANAAYTTGALVVSAVNIVPMHLSTALFALSRGDDSGLRREVRRSMSICTVLALVSGPAFLLLSRTALGIFNPKYRVAAEAMTMLGFSTLPIAVKTHYVAIARVRGKMRRAASRASLGAMAEIGFTAVGAKLDGLTGAGAGFLCATVFEALLFAPVVLGVVFQARSSVRAPSA